LCSAVRGTLYSNGQQTDGAGYEGFVLFYRLPTYKTRLNKVTLTLPPISPPSFLVSMQTQRCTVPAGLDHARSSNVPAV